MLTGNWNSSFQWQGMYIEGGVEPKRHLQFKLRSKGPMSKLKRHPRCYYPLKKLLRKTGMNTMDIYSKGYHYVYITLSRRNIQMIFRAHSDDNHFMVSVPWGEGCFKTLQAKIILMIG
jgi:hypothetical protein